MEELIKKAKEQLEKIHYLSELRVIKSKETSQGLEITFDISDCRDWLTDIFKDFQCHELNSGEVRLYENINNYKENEMACHNYLTEDEKWIVDHH